MPNSQPVQGAIALGDPVPWFSASLITGGKMDLHVFAGRWVVLCFMGAATNPRVDQELSELLRYSQLFDEDRLIVRVVFTAPPQDAAKYAAMSTPALSFI